MRIHGRTFDFDAYFCAPVGMSREEELEAEIIRLQTDLVNATTEIEQLSLDK